MEVQILNQHNSVVNSFLAELRDVKVQKDSMRFRKNIERVGWFLGYEASKCLDFKTQSVNTPLAMAEEKTFSNALVVASVLRAGMPLHNGVLEVFDRAENAFISAYRIEAEDGTLDFKIEYNASPNLKGKTVLLCDPMLATGNSMLLAYEALLEHGTPEQVIILSVIGSEKGVELVKKKFPSNTVLIIGAVDPILNEQSYIVPGLGDAGDLCYGTKE
ncbi:uracil phosphoribosyltransferase [Salibacteraceae bacterium]|jgi:uracil phosphoribosyltransferase|nr:uracil phosphoribosyltransferase [Crocinitomicaceae bacterium]MDC1204218.1 uracil phosphoribosyltransferase [Salibacteraceae bacterium]|tara:strand:- start:17564 stop:18214 length:651 start_codon:yes stop_codon:yes gene_type:complete